MEGLEGLISLRELVLDRNKIKVSSSQSTKQFCACIFKIFIGGRVMEIISVPDRDWVTVACEILDFDCPCFLIYFYFCVT